MRTSDFIDQAEPLASFDAVAQRRHHAIRPDRAFRPPQIMGSHPGCVCPLPSRLGTSEFLGSIHSSRIQLPASLPSGRFALPVPFHRSKRPRYHEGLTPPGLTQAGGSLRLLRLAVPTFRPQPRDPPPGRFVSRLSATGCSRLRRPRGGSPRYPAETGSSSYGLPIYLRLLSTPPRGDAVTFNFWTCDQPRHGLAPCRQSVLTDALMAGLGPAIHDFVAHRSFASRYSGQHRQIVISMRSGMKRTKGISNRTEGDLRPSCVDGPRLARVLLRDLRWRPLAVMCPACLRGG